MTEPHADSTQRIDRLEQRQGEHAQLLSEYRTLRTMLGGAILLIVSTAATAGGMILTDRARLEGVEQRVREHEGLTSHRGTVEAMSELRGDLRVITSELRESNARSTEIRDRLGRLESRMDASTIQSPAPHR